MTQAQNAAAILRKNGISAPLAKPPVSLGRGSCAFGLMISGTYLPGVLQLLRTHRFMKNSAYREAVEIAETDERNHFIRSKAWAWAGYLFILIAAVSSIILRILHQDLLSLAASYTICLMLILYWVSYLILRKKY